ncbi:hypothetical protein V496_03732 [Pseudogymnoascus sp. VKM F-4515 (FW-2607)]|nr:hypothetical protein V496_03732 [Pseudogymnoascus sp. VKM F-4515 (FW-2607)]
MTNPPTKTNDATGLLYGLFDGQCHCAFSLNPNINSVFARGSASFNRLRAFIMRVLAGLATNETRAVHVAMTRECQIIGHEHAMHVAQERLDVIVQYRARIAGFTALNATFLHQRLERGTGRQLQTAKKVDLMDGRLVSIEKMLQELMARGKNTHENEDVPSAPFSQPAQNEVPKNLPKYSPSPLLEETNDARGRTTLLGHSIHAKSVFEIITSSTSLRRDPNMLGALTSLQNVIRSQSDRSPLHDLRFTPGRNLTTLSLSDFELPPIEAVEDVLGFANKNVPRIFLKLPLMDVSDFAELCRSFYTSTPNVSAAMFALVNAGLYYMFAEQNVSRSEERTFDFCHFASVCQLNFEFYADFQAFHATEMVKPYLCRLLSTEAAQMCQTLGYHRIPDGIFVTKEIQAKKLAFWNIFCLEKSLSLRLAYAPTLQDRDILTTLPSYPEDASLYSWHALWVSWIDLSKFQGRVFAELYSGGAMSLPAEYRISQARKLAADIKAWHERWISFQHSRAIYFDVFQAALEATEVVYHGLLTVTYRVIPPPVSEAVVFCSECVESARKSLELHHIAAASYKGSKDFWRGYINWTLVCSPFAPFLVIFCEAVATKDPTSLYSLGNFVASIEPFSTATEVTDRLYQLCSAFYNVLKAYLEKSQSAASTTSLSTDSLPQPNPESAPQLDWNVQLMQPLYGSDGGILQPNQMPGMENWGSWPADDLFGQDFSMISRW